MCGQVAPISPAQHSMHSMNPARTHHVVHRHELEVLDRGLGDAPPKVEAVGPHRLVPAGRLVAQHHAGGQVVGAVPAVPTMPGQYHARAGQVSKYAKTKHQHKGQGDGDHCCVAPFPSAQAIGSTRKPTSQPDNPSLPSLHSPPQERVVFPPWVQRQGPLPARLQLRNEQRHLAGALGPQHICLVQCRPQLAPPGSAACARRSTASGGGVQK